MTYWPSQPLLIREVLTPVAEGTASVVDILIDDRTIVAVGSSLPAPERSRIIEGRHALALPGFVNMHSHSYGTLCRHDGAGLPLEPWMNYASAGTIGRTVHEIEVATALHAIEALRTGTTTLVDHIGGAVSGLDTAIAIYERIGIRARIAPMIGDIPLPQTLGIPAEDWPSESGYGAPDFAVPDTDSVAETLALRRSCGRGHLVDVILGPSAPQRCSRSLLERVADASVTHDLPVHTHLLESRLQGKLSARGPNLVQLLHDTGLLNERLSTAHNVWLAPADLEQLAAARVTLVHNPQSNLQLGSGIADVSGWTTAQARVALGTDSVNCGGSPDMLNALRLASILHRPGIRSPGQWPTPYALLPAASSVGAQALGIGKGVLAPGEPADLALFPTDTAPFATGQDPLGTLVLGAWDHAARTVIVDGRVVIDEGIITTIDEAAVIAAAGEAREGLMRRNARLTALADAQRTFLTAAARFVPAERS